MVVFDCSFCCGLFELGTFPIGNTEEEFKEDIFDNESVEDFFYKLVDEFCDNDGLFCTISMQTQRYMYELLTAVGFQEVKRWKSTHGNYELVMFVN